MKKLIKSFLIMGLVVTSLVVVASLSFSEEVIKLATGDTIYGDIVGLDGDNVLIRIESGDQVSYPITQIREVNGRVISSVGDILGFSMEEPKEKFDIGAFFAKLFKGIEFQNQNTGEVVQFGIVHIVIALLLYVVNCLPLQMIAQKTATPGAWMAWIPILNIVLMYRIADRPLWWFLSIFIPIINIVVIFIIIMDICVACGKPKWWAVLFLVPGLSFLLLWVLALTASSDSSGSDSGTSPEPAKPINPTPTGPGQSSPSGPKPMNPTAPKPGQPPQEPKINVTKEGFRP